MTVIVLGIAWLAGIYLGARGAPPTMAALVLGLAALGTAALWRQSPAIRLAALGLAVALMAVTRSHAAQTAEPGGLALLTGQGVISLRGIVTDDPIPRGASQELRLAVQEVKTSGDDGWRAMAGGVLVTMPFLPARQYGDYLEVFGTLEAPPTVDLFDYRAYLARQGITAAMPYPTVTWLAQQRDTSPLAALRDWRDTLSRGLAQALPEPQAALAQGILLGERASIPREVTDSFARTNTTHVIAISGTNITLVIGMLFFIVGRLCGRRSGTIIAILGVCGYAMLVGLSPSVVRATIMGIIFAAGSYFGRPRDATAALAVSAALMTFWNPSVLFDLGFQLSFLATAGLVVIANPIDQRLTWLPTPLRGLLSVTLAAEATTMPLVVLYTGQLSLVGPLANLIVPPLLMPVMLSSAVTAVASALYLPIGQLIGGIAWLFLTMMIRAVELLGAVPGAALPLGQPQAPLVLAYFAVLAGLLVHHLSPTTGLHRAWRRCWSRLPAVPLLTILAIAVAISWSAVLTLPDDALHLTVLDVGQGDAILVRTPDHKVLVDGGPNPTTIATALDRRLPFWDRSIDLVVLTHPNDDHLSGLITVLERFPVAAVMESTAPGTGPVYERWRTLIATLGIKHYQAAAGQQIDLGRGVALQVLNPVPSDEPPQDANDLSIMLKLNSAHFSALLTGDVSAAQIHALSDDGQDLHATVLKVPHHGSLTGLDEAALDAIAPDVAIVSVGQGNRFGHPAPETLSLLAAQHIPLYRTDVDGSVEVVVRDSNYFVQTQ